MIIGIIIIFGVAIWLLRGYIEHERFYYQSLILEFNDRNNLPCPKPEDFDESKKELEKTYWRDLKYLMIFARFPFNRIKGKWVNKLL